MKIELLFFAGLRELFGVEKKSLDVNPNTTIRDVWTQLKEDGGYSFNDQYLLFAINEEYVSGEQKLKDGDVLAIMTPVCGG